VQAKTRALLLVMLALAILVLVLGGVAALVWTPSAPQYTPVSLKAMGNFLFDDRNGTEADVPPAYRALDGKKVVITGLQFVFDGAMWTDEFQLIDHLPPHGPPGVQERVFAHMRSGKTLQYDALVNVYGTLHICAVRQQDRVISLFSMTVDKVVPAPAPTPPPDYVLPGIMGSAFLLVATIVAVLWHRARRRQYRMRNHLCLNCGYDLRASPERCPECGGWSFS
jgi:hypothetical protein